MSADVHFDGAAMIAVLDEHRRARDLDWNRLAIELWSLSSDLNAELQDHDLCPGALVRTVRRTTMSCQYALIILRWIDRAPEDFLVGEVTDVGDTRLPTADTGHRLRWDLAALHSSLDDHRRAHELTWTALARDVGCTPSRLTNLRKARLADMDLAMRVTQLVGQPAASFVHAQRW